MELRDRVYMSRTCSFAIDRGMMKKLRRLVDRADSCSSTRAMAMSMRQMNSPIRVGLKVAIRT